MSQPCTMVDTKLGHFFAALMLFTTFACGDSTAEDSEASKTNVTVEPEAKGLAACGARKECIDAFVLGTLFRSTLVVKGGFRNEAQGMPASEYVARWLTGNPDVPGSLRITTDPVAAGRTKVRISLKDNLPEDAAGSCWFTFTIDGDRIVELEAESECAG